MRGALLLLFATLVSCSGDAKIREDSPEHLVEDLARALRAPAVEWLDEEQAASGPASLGMVASQDVSSAVIRYQRLLEAGRQLCTPWLPPETKGMPVPAAWSNGLHSFTVALASVERSAIRAEVMPAGTPNRARVRLHLGEERWLLSLVRVNKHWTFDKGLRREP